MCSSDLAILEGNDIKALYPGLENIVEQLLKYKIPFSKEGESELIDDDGIVVATAGMILQNGKIAIDPLDEKSKIVFEKQGYKAVSSIDFDINMIIE